MHILRRKPSAGFKNGLLVYPFRLFDSLPPGKLGGNAAACNGCTASIGTKGTLGNNSAIHGKEDLHRITTRAGHPSVSIRILNPAKISGVLPVFNDRFGVLPFYLIQDLLLQPFCKFIEVRIRSHLIQDPVTPLSFSRSSVKSALYFFATSSTLPQSGSPHTR